MRVWGGRGETLAATRNMHLVGPWSHLGLATLPAPCRPHATHVIVRPRCPHPPPPCSLRPSVSLLVRRVSHFVLKRLHAAPPPQSLQQPLSVLPLPPQSLKQQLAASEEALKPKNLKTKKPKNLKG